MSSVPTRVPRAHHRPDGGFRNPWPNSGPWGYGGFLKWVLFDRLVRELATDPDPDVFRTVTPGFAAPRAAPDGGTVTWVGHSTWLIQIGGLNIVTDPIWSDRASPMRFFGPRRWVAPGIPFDALPPVDVVLQSHNHYDHLDDRTVRRLAAHHPSAIWLVPLGLASFVRRRGPRSVVELDWWEEAHIGGVRFAATPAQHQSARHLTDRGHTLWCGWAIRANPHRVFFAGDTAYHPEFARIGERHGPFDLSLMPIGAYEPRWFMRYVHMNPEESVRAYHDVHRVHRAPAHAAMAAMHWGTFKLTDEAMDEPPKRVRRAWREAGLPERSLWLMAHGETRPLPVSARSAPARS